jgi:hypothetical protein
MDTVAVTDTGHLRFHDKALALAAWGIGVGVFASVGWMALEPADPRGAVSLVTADSVLLALAQTLALAAVVSGLATVLIGRKLPDAGVFAVSLGLAAVALRGATTSYLLINVAGPHADARSALAGKLAVGGLFWFLPILVAMIVAALVLRWYAGEDAGDGATSFREMSLADMPVLGGLLPEADERTKPSQGLKAMLLSFLVAAILFRLLATGSPLRSVQHGQSCFALVAAFYIGGLVAYRFFPVGSALWGCLSVPLLCLMGYIIAAMSSPPKGYNQLASVPPDIFYRALPIEYIGVGTAAAVAAFWSARRTRMVQR